MPQKALLTLPISILEEWYKDGVVAKPHDMSKMKVPNFPENLGFRRVGWCIRGLL